jgi:hypothetical protein
MAIAACSSKFLQRPLRLCTLHTFLACWTAQIPPEDIAPVSAG